MKRMLFLPVLLLAIMILPERFFAQGAGTRPELVMYRYNSSAISPLPVIEGNLLGTLKWDGLTATGKIRSGASIQSYVTASVSPGILRANMVFRTGAPDQLNRMVITSEGRVGIGTDNPVFNLHTVGNTHTTGDFYGRIHFDKHETTDDAPNTYNDEAYFELKERAVLGVPTSPAPLSSQGGLLSLAPGGTSLDHQMFFGDDGVYLRRWNGNTAFWPPNLWFKIMTEENITGTPGRIAKFTEAHKIGDSRLFENEATGNMGIDNTVPAYKLDISGTLHATGTTVVGDKLGIRNPTPAHELDVNGEAYISNRLAIGTTNPKHFALGYALSVGGNIIAEEVRVALQPKWTWADYVFEDHYRLPDLKQLELYVRTNKHLPGIPSAAEVAQNGIELGDMNRRMLEKIEELTLLIIEQQKQIDTLKTELQNVKR